MVKLSELVRRVREKVWQAIIHPDQQMNRWAKVAWFNVRLGIVCLRQLKRDKFNHVAAGLAFRTIFGLVPLLVMVGLIAQVFVGQDDASQYLQRLLLKQAEVISDAGEVVDRDGARRWPDGEGGRARTRPDDWRSLTPEQRAERIRQWRERDQAIGNLAEKLDRLVKGVYERMRDSSGVIGAIGLLVLFYAAYGLLNQIEGAFNAIYHATDRRSFLRRLMTYWFALTFVPLLIGATVYTGVRIRGALSIGEGTGWWASITGTLWSVLMAWFILCTLYKFLPNTRVRWRAAAYGALAAAVPWLILYNSFAVYVVHATTVRSVYGSFSALLFFFMYIHFSWLIVLFGLEVAYVTQHLRGLELAELKSRRGGTLLDRGWILRLGVIFAERFREGQGEMTVRQMYGRFHIPEESIVAICDSLAARDILLRTETEDASGYVLNRPAEKIALAELDDAAGDLDIAVEVGATTDSLAEDEIKRLSQLRREALEGRTLADLLAADGGGT